MRSRSGQTGRVVTCSKCGEGCCQGSTQVYRKLVFDFCLRCWFQNRLACNSFMERVAA